MTITPKVTKGAFVEYLARGLTRTTAVVRTCHRDGTFTIEACHFLTPEGAVRGCYLGYRYRMNAADLCRAA